MSSTGRPLAANAVRKNPVPLRGIGPRGTGPQLQVDSRADAGDREVLRGLHESAVSVRQARPARRAGLRAGAMENAGLIVFRDALLRIDAQFVGRHVPQQLQRQRARDRAPVVRRSRHRAVVGRHLAQRGLRDLGAGQGDRRAQARVSRRSRRGSRAPSARCTATACCPRARSASRSVDQGDIENAFDGITYQKGAAVLRMFEEWIGEDIYRDAMRDYLAKHRSAAAVRTI